jgi:hypothetical protein
VEAIGVPGLHFHDLRHTGNAFAAASGAGLKDLMTRMGHDSERAAMIYQHEARGADAAITDAIDAHIDAEQSAADDGSDGLAGPLLPAGQWPANGTVRELRSCASQLVPQVGGSRDRLWRVMIGDPGRRHDP